MALLKVKNKIQKFRWKDRVHTMNSRWIKEFPQLETQRFYLRRITLHDAKEIYHYFSNDEVTKYYDLDSFTTIQQAIDLIEHWDMRFKENQGIRWGIAKKEDNKLIGSCGYHNLAKEHHKAEIGYEVAPNYWRKGVITEVLKPILTYGFQQMKFHRIEAFYDPENIASQKSLEKAGFCYEGTLKECFFEKGKFVDAVICSLLSKDYFLNKA